MSKWLPQTIAIVILYAIAAVLVPCDGDCTPAEEVRSYVF
jgi:hypothetical protein